MPPPSPRSTSGDNDAGDFRIESPPGNHHLLFALWQPRLHLRHRKEHQTQEEVVLASYIYKHVLYKQRPHVTDTFNSYYKIEIQGVTVLTAGAPALVNIYGAKSKRAKTRTILNPF